MTAFQDKAVIVTGGASGIGRTTALRFAERGARVIIADRDETNAAALVREAAQSGLRLEWLPLDLAETQAIQSFVAKAEALFPTIDILVNAAGWGRSEPFVQNDDAMIEQVLAINLGGPIRLTRGLLPAILRAQGGRIVNIASDAGRVGSAGNTVYSAAKGGVIAFTKALARELARHGINVNCVSPGPTDTPFFARTPQRLREALARGVPLGRIGTPDEVADAILFLAGSGAGYITGQVLSVSGGLTMSG